MIHNKITKVIYLFFSIVIMMGVYGCMRQPGLSVDDCLEYMKTKYNGDFTYLEPYDNFQPTARALKIYVQSDQYPDSKILVVEERDYDENILFHDNFVAIKYEQDTGELLTNIATQVYGECRVMYSVHRHGQEGVLPDYFNNSTTFADYIADRKSTITFSVLLPPEHSIQDKDREINDFYEECCENKIICIMAVYYVNDLDMYQSMDSEPVMMQSGEWYDAHGVLMMDAEFGTQSLKWR